MPGSRAAVGPGGNPVAVIGQPAVVEGDLSDAAVIAASLLDAGRFGEVFDRHYAEINRYLGRRVGATMADEIAAETFVAAFRSRARFNPAAADARPWLFGIAANLARRHWRTERRRLRAYARTGIDPIADDSTDEVHRRLDAVADGPRLAGALAALSVGEREVLLLFAWAELSYEEISIALSISPGTVRSRLSRARAHIRELLAPNGQVSLDSATEGGTHE
jgi:RNA polymerase sigma factor (sigma-70 family)